MAKNFLYILFLFFYTSCQVYDYNFDCPPGEGVPCTPVSEIEKMIVETERGPDIFVAQLLEGYSSQRCKEINNQTPRYFSQKRVWIAPQVTYEGDYVEEYYLYLPEESYND